MNKKRPPLRLLRNLGAVDEPSPARSTSPRRAPPAEVAPPSANEDGIFGAIRRNKRLKKATAPKNDARRQTVGRVKDFMSRNSPEGRDVPSPFEGSIYGDDDEGEN